MAAVRGSLIGHLAMLLWSVVLIGLAVWRTFVPLRYRGSDRLRIVGMLTEIAVTVVAVIATGYWDSPFVFCLLTPVIAAGFARGFAFSIATAAAVSVGIGVPAVTTGGADEITLANPGQLVVVLVLSALVAGYARRLFGEAEERHSLAMDRMGRLAEANALLFSLHRVAQSLPASLDLDEVLASTMTRLRDLFAFDAGAVLIWDEAISAWIVAAGEGIRARGSIAPDDLPAPVAGAAGRPDTTLFADLLVAGTTGLAPMSRSALYAPLRARGALVGLVALEHQQPGQFGAREVELIDGFVEAAALAIDNARWFARLRTVGADEERTRIARDLHDRVGQSLAYLAFELDRIVKRSEEEIVHSDLVHLRHDVRGVVSEVREALYDLRTDVSEQQDLGQTLESFLQRVGERTGLEISFKQQSTGRLALPQERELWRIAQEAITNVERHARAGRLTIRWQCDGERALLVVSDNGRGFPPGQTGRLDSYGIVGMRERADAVGARLDIDSVPGQGTTVRCRLEVT